VELRFISELVLDGTSLKSIGVRPIGFVPIWVPTAFVEYTSFYIKSTVYENEKTKLYHLPIPPGGIPWLFP